MSNIFVQRLYKCNRAGFCMLHRHSDQCKKYTKLLNKMANSCPHVYIVLYGAMHGTDRSCAKCYDTCYIYTIIICALTHSSHFSENGITQWPHTISQSLVVNWIYHQNCGSLKAVHKVVTVQFLDIQIAKHKIFRFIII